MNILHSFDTSLPADSVEWCPIDGKNELLICGTYQLQETSLTNNEAFRLGCIYLFRLEPDNLKLSNTLNTSGILDLKWKHHDENCIIGAAKSNGMLSLYSALDDSLTLLEELVTEENGLLLSLDWNLEDCVGISTSLGNISILDAANHLAVKAKWHAHDLEAWICAFDAWNKDVIYSGADDCKLKGWDLRTDNSKPVFSIKHSMGVTSMQSNSHKAHYLASGSYDETISIWDTRKMKRAVHELSVGGGVWRVKWEPTNGILLAAACMSNGVQLVEFFTGDNPSVLASFKDHDSLLYGVDWNRAQNISNSECDQNRHTIASCSFYDAKLNVWQWNS